MNDSGPVVTGVPLGAPGSGRGTTAPRSPLRSVAVPAEHGGWGLTIEPALLGLLVRWSVPGLCLALAAVVAFVARTPLKVLLVDAHRGRSLERGRLARRVLALEAVVLVALAAVATARAASPRFWWPLVAVAPLVGVQLVYDMRSRSRRLVPELAGAVGITGVAAMIVLAGGGGVRLGVAMSLVLAARCLSAIVAVRGLVRQLHGHPVDPRSLTVADGGALAVAGASVVVGPPAVVGAVAVVAAIAAQRLLARRPAPRAAIIGMRQSLLGLVVVLAGAIGAHALA